MSGRTTRDKPSKLGHSQVIHELDNVVLALRARFPQAKIVAYSAARQHRLDDLLEVWSKQADTGRDLDIDYVRYGVAEARLAWLNQTLALSAQPGATFSPEQWTKEVLTRLGKSCRDLGYIVGHIKLMVTSEHGTTKASLTDISQHVSVDLVGPESAERGRATLNARVECEPGEMERLVVEAVRAASDSQQITPVPQHGRSFKPGQPVPTHRLLAAEHFGIVSSRGRGV